MAAAKFYYLQAPSKNTQRQKPIQGSFAPLRMMSILGGAGYPRAINSKADGDAKFVRGGWVGFKWWLVVVVMLGAAVDASASGPRWVTGPPFFTGQQGVPVGWRPGTLNYSTDPGDLSATVNRDAADALVAAAAGVWNLPVANLNLVQSGVLAEHVSGANVYLGSSGLVWPTDVASGGSTPIAVIYDRDGSVTDLLLGGGASAPANCRQNAVTEDVDLFDPAGYILHAVVIVNGRCTGTAPQAQLQLRYQLQRAFGRVLGLAWSQANDNVFTGVPAATAGQAQHWPVMHPIDILCGPYTYQCLPQPFVLRPDDIASMVMLYGIGPNDNVPAGKQVSLAQATAQAGHITFPDGQGMAGVNVLLQRMPKINDATATESWVETSAVTGTWFRRSVVTPLTTQGTDALTSQGSYNTDTQGYYRMAYIPWPAGATQENHVLTTEAVNPLYVGEYSLGPYGPGTVSPSGSSQGATVRYLGLGNEVDWDTTVADAPLDCGAAAGLDGSESQPAPVDATGWWQGTICGVGHASWVALDVRAGRSLTLDVTALDEAGLTSTTKLMPVLGAWSVTDPLGSQPTLGRTPGAFNATSAGTTRLGLNVAQAGRLRLTIADQRGEGRPDFNYRGRILYADSVVPAVVPVAGATVTIYGLGFRAGNAVTVNGVAATVTGWTASTLTVAVPAMAAGATAGTPLEVVVTDRSSGAASAMSGALRYDANALPETLRLVSAPSGDLASGSVAATPFAVQVLRGDGVTPVAGESVTLAVTTGSAQLGACGAASCVVVTDAQGMASTSVLPLAAGVVALQALDGTMSQTASFIAQMQVGSVQILYAPSGSVPVQAQGQWMAVQALAAGGGAASYTPVTFTSIPAGAVRFTACAATSCTLGSNSGGQVSTGLTPLVAGPVQLVVTAGGASAKVSFNATPNVDVLTVVNAPSGTAYVGSLTPVSFGAILFASDGVTPLFGRKLTFSAPAGVVFDACGASTCTMLTNWSGVGTGVLPQVPGTYTLQVTDGVSVRTATFTAIARTMQLKVMSVPADGTAVGAVASTVFSVQLLDAWGSPQPSRTVTLVAAQVGAVRMLGCGSASTCTLGTDANGMVSTLVEPLIAGPVSLQAVSGQLSQTVTFVASAAQASVTAVQPVLYVAESATVSWTLAAALVLNGGVAAGQVVTWTGSAGLAMSTDRTLTGAAGTTQIATTVGPLAAGGSAGATACAWGSVCAAYQALGVGLGDLRVLVVISPATVSSSAPVPVVLQVIDTAGHPVAGAAVAVYQTASEATACPARGRCPSAPVVASGASSAMSDVQGLVSVLPVVWGGGAGVTHLAVSVGTQGFVALDLSTTP